MVPRENKNNAYAKFGGRNKKYHGIIPSGPHRVRVRRGGGGVVVVAWLRSSEYTHLPPMWSNVG